MTVFPELNVLIGFLATSNASGTGPYMTFNDATYGKFDTGTFAGDYIWADVTQDVRSLTTTRGRQRQIEAFAAGTATLVLDNNAGNYDPDNPASIYNTTSVSVLPMRPISISASWNGVNYPIFYGYVDSFVPDYAPGRYSDAWCTVTASDAMKILQNIPSSGAAPIEATGARITRLLDNCSWPSTLRTIATGDCTLQATTLSSTVAQDIQAAVDSEYGRWYFGADGKLIFENRSSRSADQTAVATWSDTDAISAVLSTDTFNRANNATVLGSTDGTGSVDPVAWVQSVGVLGINTNQAYATTIAGGVALAHVPLGQADVDLSLTLSTVATTAGRTGIVFRYTDAGNYWVWANWAGYGAIFFKVVGGSGSQVGFSNPLATNGQTLRVVANGSTLDGYIDGSLVETVVDTFNQTATRHGFAFVDTTARFDNWYATGLGATDAGLLYAEIGRVIDDDLIRNRVSIQNIGGTAQVLTDAMSITQYQSRSFSASNLLLQADSDAYQLANLVLYNGKQLTGCRFDQVLFEPVTNIAAGDPGDLWPEVLGRQISDRVSVVVTPPFVSAMTMGAFVEGVSHTITTEPQNWTTSFHASRAQPTSFIMFNDATFGVTFSATAAAGQNTFGM